MTILTNVRLNGTVIIRPTTDQQEFTTPGTYSWTAPAGVTSVNVVCVGGGGGGGGSMTSAGSSATAGGTSYFVNTSTVAAGGGGVVAGTNNSIGVAGGAGGVVLAGSGTPGATGPNRVSSFFAEGGGGAGLLNGSTGANGVEFSWGGSGGTGANIRGNPIGNTGGAGNDVTEGRGGSGGNYGGGGGGGRDGLGGGGGALAYINNYSVIPGNNYTVVVGSAGSGQSSNFPLERGGGDGAGGAVIISRNIAYAFGAIPASINEGVSGTFNIVTNSVSDGTTLYWTIATNAGDFGTVNGSFTITNNAGSFTVTPTADLVTEGVETFTVSIRTVSISGTVVATSPSVTINDVTYGFSVQPASINEGGSGTFTVSTTNVADATTLYWTINNTTTTTADFSASSGSFTVTSNSGTFSVSPTADLLTEGAETFTVSVRTVSISGTVVATSPSVTINDTSLSSLITSGLQLWLDVGQTASYPGTGTAWTDLTVNGRNGAIVGGPTYTSAGASSYLSFGSGATQRTSFTYQTPIQSAATAFTWDIWVYPVANQDSYVLMGYRGTTPLQFYKLTTQKFEMYPAEIFYAFTLNVWQNITAVYDGTQSGTANMKLYVNGTAVGLRDADQPDFSPSAMPFYIGGDPVAGEYATARINQVAVYNRALSASEVSTNFNTFKGRFGL